MKIVRAPRIFLSEDYSITTWDSLKPYYDQLINTEFTSKEIFVTWLKQRSELDAVVEEDCAWRYIRMTINTKDEKLTENYLFFVNSIQPEIAPFENELNTKLVASPFYDELSKEEAFHIYFRSVKTAIDTFSEKNIALDAEISEKAQQYGAISAAQNIEYNGETMTMQKASLFLKDQDESIRKEVFEKMAARRNEDVDKLNELYSDLIAKRNEVAINAGFANYRDYRFAALGRFDYSKKDCFDFHDSVKQFIVPIVKEIQEKRLKLLGKDKFKPWDLEVDPSGNKALAPFENGQQLLDGTVRMFEQLDPYFSDCIQTMNEMGHLDLESKDGKSPGGYNYPLYEIGVPFIFMNAVGAQRDLVTMVHEGGHAIHSFLTRDLELTAFKNFTSEVAELASMAMEMLTMKYWDDFYVNKEDLNRAKREQLEGILKIMPWIAQIDEFQHWVYENHPHTHEERATKWKSLSTEYGTGLTDWSGYEAIALTTWQRQLHLFELPFYYIEYGIAQLGALGVWRNSIQNEASAIEKYKNALQLGYTKSIPEIYATAGVKFDFSASYLKELAAFVQTELKNIN
ncbi:MAG: M3 family oligoendopeptidase [Bacteroidota bacterium]